ncbi:2-isopropylmalate synthase [Rhodococcus sp. NPDC058521]|uniref:2-isopropylmalate synthase n=1 Tax=Rhodococcus sp. NPDC058521 TaxID=3346536 RepID=UPI00365A9A12
MTSVADQAILNLNRPEIQQPSGQPWWNRQKGSSMPFGRYANLHNNPADLRPSPWATPTIDRAPLWSSVDLRDGNQALPNPMDWQRKTRMFDLLVRLGFKDIEVGYPSASQADFDFVRSLIQDDLIPDDVTIAVFTPARPELIERTFEAIQGADQAVVHLCNATACLWREVVFGMSANEVRHMADSSAVQMMRLADRLSSSNIRFEYSLETFNVTEPGFALEVSNSVASIFEASVDRPLILNLPTTVETDYPNVFANQVEWMNRNLANRESIILSVHPHNDRGTAVASAEMALMSGADRVEGTLFGSGERTGNVCLATLALNLFSRGVDPQLDFSEIDQVRSTVEECNQMPIGQRHPYAGDLVYTAFSGTHQDAIAKGMASLQKEADTNSVDVRDVPWNVPYLPIDPKDVGRSYQSLVRLNSQSGKGGIAHVLRTEHGLHLPKSLQRDFARVVQRFVDRSGVELDTTRLWNVFCEEYIDRDSPLLFKEFHAEESGSTVSINVVAAGSDGSEIEIRGAGRDVSSAMVNGLEGVGYPIELVESTTHVVADSQGERSVAYTEVLIDTARSYGVGIDDSDIAAELRSVLSALNRALNGATD